MKYSRSPTKSKVSSLRCLLFFICSVLQCKATFSNPFESIKPLFSSTSSQLLVYEILNPSQMLQRVRNLALCGYLIDLIPSKQEQIGEIHSFSKYGETMMMGMRNLFKLNLVFEEPEWTNEGDFVLPLVLKIKEFSQEEIFEEDSLRSQSDPQMKAELSTFQSISIPKETSELGILGFSCYLSNQFEGIQINIEDSFSPHELFKNIFFAPPSEQERTEQVWLYLILSLVRMADNLYTSILQYYKEDDDDDKTIKIQFLSVLCIDTFLFFFNLRFAQLSKSYFILSVPMALLSLGLDFSVLLKNLDHVVGVLLFSFILGAHAFLSLSAELLWLLIPYVMVPLTEIYNCFVQKLRQKYDYLIYLGHLIPAWVIMTFLKVYPHNFAKMTPDPHFALTSGIFLVFGLGIKKMKGKIQKRRATEEIGKYIITMNEVEPDDVCSICMQSFLPEIIDQSTTTQLETQADQSPQSSDSCLHSQEEIGEIMKTRCNHRFHTQCFTRWIKMKEICPYCRVEIAEMARVFS